MEVSQNSGTPSHPFLHVVLYYQPSILGYPHLWKAPYGVVNYSEY